MCFEVYELETRERKKHLINSEVYLERHSVSLSSTQMNQNWIRRSFTLENIRLIYDKCIRKHV